MFLQTSFAIAFSATIIAHCAGASLQLNADCLDFPTTSQQLQLTAGGVFYNPCSGKAAIVGFEHALLTEHCCGLSYDSYPKISEDEIEIPMIATIEDGQKVCPKECTMPIPIHINAYELYHLLKNKKSVWQRECERYCQDGVWYAVL